MNKKIRILYYIALLSTLYIFSPFLDGFMSTLMDFANLLKEFFTINGLLFYRTTFTNVNGTV